MLSVSERSEESRCSKAPAKGTKKKKKSRITSTLSNWEPRQAILAAMACLKSGHLDIKKSNQHLTSFWTVFFQGHHQTLKLDYSQPGCRRLPQLKRVRMIAWQCPRWSNLSTNCKAALSKWVVNRKCKILRPQQLLNVKQRKVSLL